MLRALIGIILAAGFCIVPGLPLLLVAALIGLRSPEKKYLFSRRVIRGVFRALMFVCGTKLTVRGLENIPEDRAVLFVSNHRSVFDIVTAYTVIPPTVYIAKEELGKIPLLAQWFRNIRCILLSREHPKQALRSINEAIEMVRGGTSVWIFPEGHRNHTDTLLPFKEGSFRIAEKSGCPVIPTALNRTDDILANHMPFVHPTAVTLTFGEPVETEGMERSEKKALTEKVSALVQQLYDSGK